MVHINCIDFNDKNNKRITFDDGRRGEEEGEGVRIKVMRTRVYLKAAAED